MCHFYIKITFVLVVYGKTAWYILMVCYIKK